MQNESQNIEYKESWRDEYLKWICGFANAQGGRIYIGVNDQKEVIGLSDAKRLLEDIPNKIVRSIELWNYGLLPKELTPAALLQKHSSYPRNHNIANVFYKAGFVESWGRGFKKIAEEFERAKLPLPTIEENGGGVMAIIQRKTIDEVIAERGGDVGDMSEINVGDMSETNVGNMSESELSERQLNIISMIKGNPFVTGKEMSETMSVTQRTIERDLSVLQKAGIIRHEGRVNAGVWVILEQGNTNS